MVALIAPRRNRWVKKFEVTTCMSQIRIYFELIRSYIHVCISLSFSFFSVASPLVWLWRYKAASNNNKASSARLSFLHCAPPPPPPPSLLFSPAFISSLLLYIDSIYHIQVHASCFVAERSLSMFFSFSFYTFIHNSVSTFLGISGTRFHYFFTLWWRYIFLISRCFTFFLMKNTRNVQYKDGREVMKHLKYVNVGFLHCLIGFY